MGVKKIPMGGGGGTFDGTMDDIPNGATYVKTENNLTDAEKTKLESLNTPTILTLDNNQSTGANTTPIDLTSMSFSYDANSVYTIEILAFVQSAAATTGIGFLIDVSSVVTKLGLSFFHQLATTGTITGGSLIADNALIGVSSGLPNTTENFVQGKGILITGANTGTAQFRFRSETTAVTTINANSKFIITKIS